MSHINETQAICSSVSLRVENTVFVNRILSTVTSFCVGLLARFQYLDLEFGDDKFCSESKHLEVLIFFLILLDICLQFLGMSPSRAFN